MFLLIRGGSGTVTVTADPNLNFASRTTTLNFNADGEVLKEVEALQFGNTIIPQFYLSPTVSSSNNLWGVENYNNLRTKRIYGWSL